MAPAHSKGMSKDAADAAESVRKRNARINTALARGKALQEEKQGIFKPSTPLLEDSTCSMTLQDIMDSEGLTFEQAVEVCKKFRAQSCNETASNPKAGMGSLPSKPSSEKSAGASSCKPPVSPDAGKPRGILRIGGKNCQAAVAEGKEEEGGETTSAAKPTSNKRKNATSMSGKDSAKKPKEKEFQVEEPENEEKTPSPNPKTASAEGSPKPKAENKKRKVKEEGEEVVAGEASAASETGKKKKKKNNAEEVEEEVVPSKKNEKKGKKKEGVAAVAEAEEVYQEASEELEVAEPKPKLKKLKACESLEPVSSEAANEAKSLDEQGPWDDYDCDYDEWYALHAEHADDSLFWDVETYDDDEWDAWMEFQKWRAEIWHDAEETAPAAEAKPMNDPELPQSCPRRIRGKQASADAVPSDAAPGAAKKGDETKKAAQVPAIEDWPHDRQPDALESGWYLAV